MTPFIDCLLIGYTLYELHNIIDVFIALVAIGEAKIGIGGETDGQ